MLTFSPQWLQYCSTFISFSFTFWSNTRRYHSFPLTLIYLDICVYKKAWWLSLCPSVYILRLLKVFRGIVSVLQSVFIWEWAITYCLFYCCHPLSFVRKLQCKQASVTTITEKVDELTKKQESPEHKEISHLNDQWLDLCLHSNNLCLQRERRSPENTRLPWPYECCQVLRKITTEWDNLAR